MKKMNLISILTLAAALALSACSEPSKPAEPKEVEANTACALDGMTLADFPGPKAQIVYDRGETDFFCDTKEMFSIFLRPEQKKRIVGIFVQDMAKTDWKRPEGHWIDAKKAFYVNGSSRTGSMGPTLASFAAETNAQTFSAQFGGTVVPFDKVTLDIVDLTGGVVNDSKM